MDSLLATVHVCERICDMKCAKMTGRRQLTPQGTLLGRWCNLTSDKLAERFIGQLERNMTLIQDGGRFPRALDKQGDGLLH